MSDVRTEATSTTDPTGKSAAAPVSAAAAAHAKLREAILCGEIPPGEPISQVELAHVLGISRIPLREALRALEHEGLIEAPPRRQVRVVPVSASDLDQLYGLRIMTESLAVHATVPMLTPEDDTFFSGSVELMDELAQKRELQRWEQCNDAFHKRLISGAGPRIQQQCSELVDYTRRFRRLYAHHDARAWLAESEIHAEIVDACRRRDARGAADALVRHLSRTALVVLAHVAPEHDPIHVRAAVRIVGHTGK